MNDVLPTIVRVREGQIADAESWIYAWVTTENLRVVYVGGTGMSPKLRAWLHLNDSNPEIGRVAARYPRFNIEPLDVLAFPIPDGVSRLAAKIALVDKLSMLGLLADDYVGDAPLAVETPADPSLMRQIQSIARQISDYRPVT